MEYTKQSLTFDEQADLIIGRGMICNRDELISCLKNVGYYRLSGYWYDFRNLEGSFKPGTEFSVVWNTYAFDRQFRLLVLDATERVEICLRAQLAYGLSQAGGAFGYLDSANLPRLDSKQYDHFINKCLEKHRHSRERFIEHFKTKYGDAHKLPPYWVLAGTMDFGQVLTLYRGAPVDIRNRIAQQMTVSAKVLESWLVCLNTVRNICAHHGRLWNRVLGTRPVIPHDKQWHEPYEILPDRMFGALSVLSHLLGTIAPQSEWHLRLLALFDEYPTIPKMHMGFKAGWQTSPLWEKWLYLDDIGNVNGRSLEAEVRQIITRAANADRMGEGVAQIDLGTQIQAIFKGSGEGLELPARDEAQREVVL
ncbi:MAG: Abi family protein [Coriobacteriales bacterium]|jgi:abortive infection bacteriophage resistance protein|nr:Abi family protein [Coriobacteriales bacterium]